MPDGTALDHARLKAWRTGLEQWAEPELFRAQVNELISRLGATAFFNKGGLQFLRDAWIGARLATALPSTLVRLSETERPDFEIQIGNEIRAFEATEADMPGRRRGDEYRQDIGSIQMDPVEDWRKRFDAIEPAVASVVRKKLAKNYDPQTSLAIYVNLGCYGAYVTEGIPILREQTRVAKDAFREVFVLWEGTLFSFWRSGQPNGEKWGSQEADDS